MRFPDWWEFVVLGLAAYRIVRLLGWDEWPPAARVRGWVIGEEWVPSTDVAPPAFLLDDEGERPAPPGKPPESEVPFVEPVYRRPVLAHLVHCPFCLGWWVSLATFGLWLGAPTQALWIALPFALSGAVGLVSKNWDP